jgi:hypothetical protein
MSNLAVAFEAYGNHGRAVAQSTFHHFADYNWDTRLGAPSFVDEPPSDVDRLCDHRFWCIWGQQSALGRRSA